MCVLGGPGQCVFCLYHSAILIGGRAIDLIGFELGDGRNDAAIIKKRRHDRGFEKSLD